MEQIVGFLFFFLILKESKMLVAFQPRICQPRWSLLQRMATFIF
jgi:hypothetical protein